MFKNATPEKAIAFLRFTMASAFFLPLNSHASRLKITCYNILKFLAFLNSFLSLYPVINALQTSTDPMDVSESAVFLIGLLLAISHIAISIARSKNIRMVLELTEDVCKNANDSARRLFQRYMEQFSTFYGVLIIWTYATGMTFILKALIMSDPYPLNAIYPFRVDYQPLKTIIFLHQSLYICNVSGNSSVNVFCGFLLFFAAARFEILKMKLRNVKNTEDLIIRMEEYYVVKEYKEIIRFTPCAVILAVVALLMCGMNLLQPQPLTVKMQYLSVAVTVGVTIFMFAWPADNLLYQVRYYFIY
ncbi:uncharacterized protein LOC105663983 isoform X2 [Megachile rotundata]|uniref:uncharacterized protein LOC105663983 isoform X2 n=1 Tax=Megachile rotundata TaxID=143995 RepID=UPI003FD58DA3